MNLQEIIKRNEEEFEYMVRRQNSIDIKIVDIDFVNDTKAHNHKATKELLECVLKQIEEYRCFPDEIHCTCMDALKQQLLDTIKGI